MTNTDKVAVRELTIKIAKQQKRINAQRKLLKELRKASGL